MTDKKLGSVPLIDATASVKRSTLGRYTEVGARTSLVETMMDDYSYIVNDGNVIYTTIGKFCSIAAMVRINPGNHPMHRATQAHFTYRASAYFDDADDEALLDVADDIFANRLHSMSSCSSSNQRSSRSSRSSRFSSKTR